MLRAFLAGLTLGMIALSPTVGRPVRVAQPQLGATISGDKGKTVGQVADVLRAIAAREHIDFVFVRLTGTSAEMLESKAAEAVAPFVATADARRRYDLTSTLMILAGSLFVRAPGVAADGMQEMAGKTIATPTFDPFVAYIHAMYPSVHVLPTKSYEESLDLVLAGKADEAALNSEKGASIVAASYAGKISVPLRPFLVERLVLAVLKGQHPKLVAKVNAGIAAIQADGTFAQIEAKWRGGSPPYSEPESTPTCRSKLKYPTSLDCPPAL